jgi:hypothetical protein
VQRAPGIPHALCFPGREINAQLGRIARRDREAASGIVLPLESFEVGVHEALFDPMQHNAPVMPGLDPGIHLSS